MMQPFNQDYLFFNVRKKMRFWRLATAIILGLSLTIIGLIHADTTSETAFFPKDHIVRLHIDDMIIDETDYAKTIRELADNQHVKAVIVNVNSPGGTTVDSQLLYDALRFVGKKKPIVTQMQSVAASGGYIVSLASDYIIANGNTITGSVGVIMQVPEFSGLMKNLGIGLNEIRTTNQKGEPSMYYPMGNDAKANLTAMVSDSYAWFLDLVKTRRKMTDENFASGTKGGVFSGRQAVKLGLVDSLGDEKTALDWLKKNHKIDSKLDIIDLEKPKEQEETLFGTVFVPFIERIIGFSLKKQTDSVLNLDGMLCLWHI
jgi:protease IV